MRKVEAQMVKAISLKVPYWKSGNTEVETNTDNEGYTVSSVSLHGHTIAEVSDTCVIVNDRGYQTATTKSRLNAILNGLNVNAGVYQKNFEWFLQTENETREMFSANAYFIARN